MLIIKGTDIQLTRGNSANISLLLTDDQGQAVTLDNGDKVIFKVKTPTGTDKIIKILTNADYGETGLDLTMSPNDTLDMQCGTYVYDCILVLANGEAYTFIGESKFVLLRAIGTIEDVGDGE